MSDFLLGINGNCYNEILRKISKEMKLKISLRIKGDFYKEMKLKISLGNKGDFYKEIL